MALERTAVGWRATAKTQETTPSTPRPRSRPARRVPVGGVVGLGIVAALVLLALAGPALVGHDPARQDLAGRLAPPVGLGGEATHPLGTDQLGRDLLARVAEGARLSLLLAAVATLAAGAAGTILGAVAGYAGGWVDRLVTWLVDVQLAVPFVVVAIAVAAVLEPGIWRIVLILSLTGWVGYARVVRLQAASLRRAPWLEAARALGAGPARLLGRHLLPNMAGPIVLLASQQAAALILYEAALSYLGLGVGGDAITWGGLIEQGQETLPTAWWVATVPGAAVALTVLGLNLIGDWLAGRGRAAA